MTNTLIGKIAAASLKVGALETDKTNEAQKYKYISADKILERAGDALAKAGVMVVPSITHEEMAQVDYTDGYGKAKTRFDVAVHFAMIVTDGETQLELPWRGRGNDFAAPDKALYKAITSGHKYFLMKLLNIGVGNEDSEHDDAQNATASSQQAKAPVKVQSSTPTQNAASDAMWDAEPSELDKARIRLHELGDSLYGDRWPAVLRHNTKRASSDVTEDVSELTLAQVNMIIGGMTKSMNDKQYATATPK